jgi:tetratricopeptide (TPR) repeat protein
MSEVAQLLQAAVSAHRSGRVAEAAAGYRAVLARSPGQVDALNLLGVVAAGQGAWAEALGWYERAVAARPGYAPAHLNRGNALAALGDEAGAEAAYRQALKLQPDLADARLNLGALLHRTGRRAEAVAVFRALVRSHPRDPRGHFNLGRCLLEAKQPEKAHAALSKAARLAPADAAIRIALSDACAALGRPDAALDHIHAALKLEPNSAMAHTHHGSLLSEAGDHRGALAAYERALAANPAHLSAIVNRGLARLKLGELAGGWADYARRADDPHFRAKRPPKPIPRWSGEDLAGKAILVYGDQGLGDEILYAAMIPELVRKAGAVTLECEPRLVNLFARAFPAVAVKAAPPPGAPQELSGFACHSSLIDLGQYLRASWAACPNRRAVLSADLPAVAIQRATLDRVLGPGIVRVGISWASANPTAGREKSIPLAEWAPILTQAGAAFVNLQYGDTSADVAAAKAELGVEIFDDETFDRRQDIDALAARLAALDLVITVSNTTAHLAASLGVPTWIMTPRGKGGLWYWFEQGDYSPWYPSVRLFRFGRDRPAADTVPAVGRALAEVVAHAG